MYSVMVYLDVSDRLVSFNSLYQDSAMNTLLAVDRLACRHVLCFLFKILYILEIHFVARGNLTYADLMLPVVIRNTKCRQL